MKRGVVAGVGLLALVVSALMTWVDIGRARQYERLVAAGDAAMARHQLAVAIEAFSGALTLRPESMLAHLRRGDTYRRQGQLEAARRDLLRASALDPTAPQPLALLGDVAIAEGRYQDAATFYRRELALDDRDERVLYTLALALFEAGQLGDAHDAVQRALALDDRVVEAHHLLGVILLARERPREALAPLAKAVALDAGFAPAREALAAAFDKAGRRRDSLEQLEALAALEPGPGRLVSLGMAYAQMGHRDAAVLALERASAKAPDNDAVRVALARVWLQQSEPGPDLSAVRRATDILRPVIERGHATSEALTLVGLAALLAGKPAEAELTLQQATRLFPVDTSGFRYLSRAATLLGHAVVARDADRRYAALVSAD